MDVFEMVTIIVIASIVGGLIKAKISADRRDPVTDNTQTAAQQARIEKLEERVRALETVVSDHGYDLKRQFRELER